MLVQSLEQLNLACVIRVVRGCPANRFERRPTAARKTPPQLSRSHRPNGLAETAMLRNEQGHVGAPRPERHVLSREPVAAGERE